MSRLEIFADREKGTVAAIVYCETEEQLREADRIMVSMSPQYADWGKRVSVDTYEVLLDETTAVPRVA